MLLTPIVVLPPMNFPRLQPLLQAAIIGRQTHFRLIVFNSREDTLQLRSQLDQLQSEAELTRSKSKNARLRFMRLTEKIENLKRRAANNVLIGKEEDAIELLVQKKKLVQALERLKVQIDVLDKLSATINEVISLKQNKLIEQVSKETEIPNLKLESEAKRISVHIPFTPSDPLSSKDFLVNIDKKLELLVSDLEKLVFPHLLTENSKRSLSDILKDLLAIREMIGSFVHSMKDGN